MYICPIMTVVSYTNTHVHSTYTRPPAVREYWEVPVSPSTSCRWPSVHSHCASGSNSWWGHWNVTVFPTDLYSHHYHDTLWQWSALQPQPEDELQPPCCCWCQSSVSSAPPEPAVGSSSSNEDSSCNPRRSWSASDRSEQLIRVKDPQQNAGPGKHRRCYSPRSSQQSSTPEHPPAQEASGTWGVCSQSAAWRFWGRASVSERRTAKVWV